MNSFVKQAKDGVTVYNGDCFECLLDLKDESVDLIFADPPYNIGKKIRRFYRRLAIG